MQNESDYVVRNPKAILERLGELFKQKCIISAHFGENNVSFMTAIVGLETNRNLLLIDTAPSEPLNKQLLSAEKVLFRTQIEGIKVSFQGRGIKKVEKDGHPVFEMPMPNAIFWMQRRQFYRIKVPLAHTASFCEINLSEDETNPDSAYQTVKFRIADIGIKGFAFFNAENNLKPYFEIDKAFTYSRLCLHSGAEGRISFVIKDIIETKINSNAVQQRIGCHFSDINPTFESAIQLYTQDVERQLKNIG